MNNNALDIPLMLVNAIDEAEGHGLDDYPEKALADKLLTGYSGKKIIGLLQRLTQIFQHIPDTCYLEIGVFQGLTLHSVALANPYVSCFGIDNFAFFDPERKNLRLVLNRKDTLRTSNVSLINQDYEDALEHLDKFIGQKKIAVYFIDGPHDYRSQLMCLELALPHLHENAVIVVDDCNYEHVRQANRDFLITHPDFKLVFQGYSRCHPKNMSVTQESDARDGWWNGINVMWHDPKNRVRPEFPPTNRDRSRFENDHIVHSHSLARYVTTLLDLGVSVKRCSLIGLVKGLRNLWRTQKARRQAMLPEFDDLNTYSNELPSAALNHSLRQPAE